MAALRAAGLRDAATDVALDDVVRLAAQLCAAPIAMLGVVDAPHMQVGAAVGIAGSDAIRAADLCALALGGPLAVDDALADPRLVGHSLVAGPPHLRFFAGAPLLASDGRPMGTLCVADAHPRRLTAEQAHSLHALARAAMRQIDLHRHARAVETLLSERTALLQVAQLVGGVADVTERLRRICGELARLTGADTASAYLLDDSGAVLQPVAGYHVPKWALAGLARMTVPAQSDGFAEAAFRQRQVVWSDDVARDPRFPQELVRRFPHRSGIVVPLVVDEVVTGGFYLTWWERARTVTDAEAALLHTVGLHTGLFLRSARLHAERETRNQRLRTLIQLNQVVSSTLDSGSILTSIAQAAARLIDAHLVRVWMADDRRRRLTLAAMSRVPGHEFPLREFGYDEGATGWVARHRQLLEIDDVFTEGSPILHPEWWRSEGVKTYLGVARPKATGSATVAGPFEAPIFSSRCRSGKTSAGL